MDEDETNATARFIGALIWFFLSTLFIMVLGNVVLRQLGVDEHITYLTAMQVKVLGGLLS